MTNRDVIIAIDPDVGGSGVAVFYMSTKMFQTGNMTLPKLVDFLKDKKGWCDGEGFSLIVVVEASYLINANWHLSWDDTKNRAAAKGKQVGRNHEIGRQIVEFCKYLEIPYEEKLPLKKMLGRKGWKDIARGTHSTHRRHESSCMDWQDQPRNKRCHAYRARQVGTSAANEEKIDRSNRQVII